jgi:chemotaxis signal transduction protein
MSNGESGYSARAAELRKEFDHTFASARHTDSGTFEKVLTLRIERELYAIRVSAIEGIVQCPKVVPLLSSNPALLGLVSIRGELLPVYSLPRLLKYDSSENVQWLLQCESGSAEKICLGIAEYMGCETVSASKFNTLQNGESDIQTQQVLTLDSVQYTVIDTVPILNSILHKKGRL